MEQRADPTVQMFLRTLGREAETPTYARQTKQNNVAYTACSVTEELTPGSPLAQFAAGCTE